MKKLIVTACAAIASAVALASTVESSNVFGVLKVAGSDGTNIKDFIIPVPWEAVGGGNIDPTKLVLANGLDSGSLLFEYGYTSGNFGAWGIGEGGAWSAANVNTAALGADVVKATATTIGRGYALIVRTKSENIYLSGQYASSEAQVEIAGATAADGETPLKPAMTLLGGNRVADIYLNSCTYSPKPDANDKIMFGNGTVYTRNSENSDWQKATGETVDFTLPNGAQGKMPTYTTENVTIPQGVGAWYVRYGTTPLTVTLPAAN